MTDYSIRTVLLRLFWFVVVLIAGELLIFTPLLSTRLGFGWVGLLPWLVGIGIGLPACVLVIKRPRLVTGGLEAILRLADRSSGRTWLAVVTVLAVAVRVGWIFAYPAKPASDAASYLHLAQQLAEGHGYGEPGSLAYWPPGYPLLLAQLFKAAPLAPMQWVYALNIFLVIATLWSTYHLALRCGNASAAKLATLLVAVWPNLVITACDASKELVLVLLLILALLLWVRFFDSPRNKFAGLVAGLLLGACALIQPSMLLLPLAVAFGFWLAGHRGRAIATSVVLIVVGMTAVIAPWSYRNYLVLGHFVLISTNGGGNFYGANNPLATGGWTERREVDLSVLGEIERNREGFRLGALWIREHTNEFARLVVEKQIRFLGDDATGVYTTFKLGNIPHSGFEYIAWKSLANIFWIFVGALMLLVSWDAATNRRFRCLAPPLFMPLVYLWILHSIFESTSKYHTPVLALVAAGLAVALTDPRREHVGRRAEAPESAAPPVIASPPARQT